MKMFKVLVAAVFCVALLSPSVLAVRRAVDEDEHKPHNKGARQWGSVAGAGVAVANALWGSKPAAQPVAQATPVATPVPTATPAPVVAAVPLPVAAPQDPNAPDALCRDTVNGQETLVCELVAIAYHAVVPKNVDPANKGSVVVDQLVLQKEKLVVYQAMSEDANQAVNVHMAKVVKDELVLENLKEGACQSTVCSFKDYAHFDPAFVARDQITALKEMLKEHKDAELGAKRPINPDEQCFVLEYEKPGGPGRVLHVFCFPVVNPRTPGEIPVQTYDKWFKRTANFVLEADKAKAKKAAVIAAMPLQAQIALKADQPPAAMEVFEVLVVKPKTQLSVELGNDNAMRLMAVLEGSVGFFSRRGKLLPISSSSLSDSVNFYEFQSCDIKQGKDLYEEVKKHNTVVPPIECCFTLGNFLPPNVNTYFVCSPKSAQCDTDIKQCACYKDTEKMVKHIKQVCEDKKLRNMANPPAADVSAQKAKEERDQDTARQFKEQALKKEADDKAVAEAEAAKKKVEEEKAKLDADKKSADEKKAAEEAAKAALLAAKPEPTPIPQPTPAPVQQPVQEQAKPSLLSQAVGAAVGMGQKKGWFFKRATH